MTGGGNFGFPVKNRTTSLEYFQPSLLKGCPGIYSKHIPKVKL